MENLTEIKKHPGGRPLKCKSPAELQQKIDNYFNDCEKNNKHLTVTGLALALDFTSRYMLIEYEGRDEFATAIKKAKLRVQNYLENKLFSNNAAGTIFNLKNNFGWQDKQEINQTTTVNNNQFDISKLTPDDLVQLSNMLKKIRQPVATDAVVVREIGENVKEEKGSA